MNERLKSVFGRQTEVTYDGDIIRTVERTALNGALRKGVQLGKDTSLGALRMGRNATVRAARDLNEVRRKVLWREIAKNYTVQNIAGIILICLVAKDRGYLDRPEAQEVLSLARSFLHPSSETIITQERTAVPTLFHKVAPGDTLTEIAQRYGVTPEKIGQANGIENFNDIDVGQIFAIPLPEWVYKPFEVEPPQDIYYLPWEYNSNPPVIEGLAHYYGAGEILNKNTASGEIFNPFALKGASWFHELGKRVRVTNLYTGMSVEIEINDRGPNRLYKYDEDGKRKNVIIDLTHAAFRQIDPVAGEILVRVELLSD